MSSENKTRSGWLAPFDLAELTSRLSGQDVVFVRTEAVFSYGLTYTDGVWLEWARTSFDLRQTIEVSPPRPWDPMLVHHKPDARYRLAEFDTSKPPFKMTHPTPMTETNESNHGNDNGGAGTVPGSDEGQPSRIGVVSPAEGAEGQAPGAVDGGQAGCAGEPAADAQGPTLKDALGAAASLKQTLENALALIKSEADAQTLTARLHQTRADYALAASNMSARLDLLQSFAEVVMRLDGDFQSQADHDYCVKRMEMLKARIRSSELQTGAAPGNQAEASALAIGRLLLASKDLEIKAETIFRTLVVCVDRYINSLDKIISAYAHPEAS